MKRSLFLLLSAAFLFVGASDARADGANALRPDCNREIIYQIVTDRFFNGSTDNDDPPQSKGLFDAERKNWHAYWGGDLAGIKQKLSYIRNLGATAIWISPAIDNVNKAVLDADGKVFAPYHGYHARDFKRVEEHFGDVQNSWRDFDSLTEAAHQLGLKVIVDFPGNHTSQYNHGEYGVLYDDGFFKCEFNYDKMKYFHHLPQVTDYNNRYQLQYGTIFYLADLDQEHPFVDRYLKASARKFQIHGADGTRLDAAKHMTWGWEQSFANSLYKYGPHFLFAEWWMESIKDPLYADAVKFANKCGMSLLDFPLAFALRKTFADNGQGDFADIDAVLTKENADFEAANEFVTFIDNHDMRRWLSINKNETGLNQALAFLMTARGVPIIYYGTEQNLHNDTNGGDDPYDRPWMNSFDEHSATYALIQSLCDIRSANPAFAYGNQTSLQTSHDAYVFQRRFGGNVAIIAINKDSAQAFDLNSIKTALPPGTYNDCLAGRLKGAQLSVDEGGMTKAIALAPQSVSIWTRVVEEKSPLIGSVSPRLPSGGVPVTICGAGFGDKQGRVLMGGEDLDVASWSNTAVRFTSPYLLHGTQKVQVVTANGAHSNEAVLHVAQAPLIPIRFVVSNPPALKAGEQLFISGDTVALGEGKKDWNSAAGPMLFSEDLNYILSVPMPSNQKVQCRLLILDKDGNLVKEESRPHSYQVPAIGSWRKELTWQD